MTCLRSQGIDLSGLEVSDGKTFRWSGSYLNDINDAETVGAELNVLGDFEPKLSDLHTDVPYLFLANCDPETQQSVLRPDVRAVTTRRWRHHEPLDYREAQRAFAAHTADSMFP